MATTTVKIRTEDKGRLDKIRSELLLKGIKLNQEELLSKIIALAETSPLLLDKDYQIQPTEDELEEILNFNFSLGKSEKTIDETIYEV